MQYKLEGLETFTHGNLSMVRVRAGDGAEGWGQMAPFNADISAQIFHRQIAPRALGARVVEPSDIGILVQEIIEAEYKFSGSYVCRALSGLDTALWDLLGRRLGKPVCEMLGGRPRAIQVYGSSMRRDIAPREEADRLARLRVDRGISAFKVGIGKVCGHDEDEWPGRTENLVRDCREMLGPNTDLLVDANSCYTPSKAIEVGKMLEEFGVCHFEEPCPYWELEWTAEVARTLAVPVAGGEQDTDLAQFRRMVDMKTVDIIQPDICHIGGMARAMNAAEYAAKAGLKCVPNSANLSMVSIFTLHMMCAIHNPGPWMEFSIEHDEWVRDLYSPALEVRDGVVETPEGPGWGVRINPDWLGDAERRITTAV